MFLGIDIGGTKTLLALFCPRGFCLKSLKLPTEKNPNLFIKPLKKHLESFLPKNLRAVTIAIPGTIKTEQNFYTISCENLGWQNFDIITPIKNLFSCQIFLANDANLATLYETNRLKNHEQKIIYLTFSTGIGGGISENNLLLPRSNSFEPGHKKYNYNGQKLEWEDFASAKALSETYGSPLNSLKLTDTSKTDLISKLLPGLSDIIKTESPDTIIIGGPLAYLLKDIEQPLINSLSPSSAHPISIKKAHRPEKSTIYGTFLNSKLILSGKQIYAPKN